MNRLITPVWWSLVFIAAAVWSTHSLVVNPVAVLLMGISGVGLAVWADNRDTRGES